jgi:hypothetical protein
MKYVAEQLGKNVDTSDLAELVAEPNEGTSLYAMRGFAQDLGLYCLAGRTSLEALENLNGARAILHLPEEDHYVVLAHIDDKYVWIIDLDRNKFFYRSELKKSDMDFSESTALLVSKDPLPLTDTFVTLTDAELQGITGGFANFSCTEVIQEDDIIGCPEPDMFFTCGGCYYSIERLCGCVPDPNGSGCSGSAMPGYLYVHCYYNEEYTYCVGDGDVYVRFMRGCECEE